MPNLHAPTRAVLQAHLATTIAQEQNLPQGSIHLIPHYIPSCPATAHKNQVGATCGLYALRNAMRCEFNRLSMGGVNPTAALRRASQVAARKNALHGVAQTADPHTEDRPGLWVPAGVSIREIAKAGKLTGVGELLDGNYVAILAKKLGYDAEFITASGNFYVNRLKNAVDQGKPAIVSMDCDKGYPVQLGGANGHWVLVVGYIEAIVVGNVLQVLVVYMHWGEFYVSPLVDLQASSNQMNLFPAGTIAKRPVLGGGRRLSWRAEPNLEQLAQTQPPNPSKYMITQKGQVTGFRRVDTSQSLNGAIITIQAPEQPLNTLQPYVDEGIQNYLSKQKRLFSWRSKQSDAALAALAAMKNAGVGLTELLHAVLWYTKPEVTDPRNKQLQVPVGEKLGGNSTLRTSLLEAYEQWRTNA